jgi:hypothetical protein
VSPSPDWGSQQRPCRPIFTMLCAPPELQQSLSSRLRPDEVWFALSRKSTLDRHVKQVLERDWQVITVYKRGSKVAASKGSFRSGPSQLVISLGSLLQSLSGGLWSAALTVWCQPSATGLPWWTQKILMVPQGHGQIILMQHIRNNE